MKGNSTQGVIIKGAIVTVALIGMLMYGIPKWNVWRARLDGEATAARASEIKVTIIAQAEAELEAAKLRAKAIEVIGGIVQQYPEYRQQEFIGAFANALENGNISQIVYIPTEAGIPLTEAGRHINR